MSTPPENLNEFSALLEVVATLRAPEGCPWDREQTHQTLTRYALEEAAELVEAIDRKDDLALCDELGDVLLQVLLHAQIAKERGAFDISNVIESLNRKMLRRHPHVFGTTKATSIDEIQKNWDEIKKVEKPKESIFSFPKSLSALIVSQKIGEKSGNYKFDWSTSSEVFEKVREEFLELEEALAANDQQHQGEEIGDLLFTLTQLARHSKLDGETVLRQTNQRFEKRFLKLLELQKLDPNQNLEVLWQRSKKIIADESASLTTK